MAMEHANFRFVLILIAIVVGFAITEGTNYVTPSPDTPCPGDQESCHTLSQYVAVGYFNNLPMNTTMQFLPGNHTLKTVIPLENLTSLAFLGDSSSLPEVTSRIVCTWPAGFTFTNITDLYINVLAFISCGHDLFGAVSIHTVQQSYISMCKFDGNYAPSHIGRAGGGGIHARTGKLTITKNTFKNNYAYHGGAIYALTVSDDGYIFVTKNIFLNNSAQFGGAVTCFGNTSLSSNTFQNNFAVESGGAISGYKLNGMFTLSHSTFCNNSAHIGGALSVLGADTLYFMANRFHSNSAYFGGAIDVSACTLVLTGNYFSKNFARFHGGAILVSTSTVWVTFHENNTSSAAIDIALLGGQPEPITETGFERNRAMYGGGLYVRNTTVRGNMVLTKNFAFEGGAAYIHKGTLTLNSTTTITNNKAKIGGGLLLSEDSKLYLPSNTTIRLSNNIAMETGGAIHVKVADQLNLCLVVGSEHIYYRYRGDCFFQLDLYDKQPYTARDSNELKQFVSSLNISLYLENNVAMGAGGDLYGGVIDKCLLNSIERDENYYSHSYSGIVFDTITRSETTPDITSDPTSLCICKNGTPLCNVSQYQQSVYPGGTIEVPVIALGQRNQPTIAIVHTVDVSRNLSLKAFEYSQNISKGCNTLRYTIHSSAVGTTQRMTLYAEGPCSADHTVAIVAYIQHCPPGFLLLPQGEASCVCSRRLQKYSDTCVVNNGTVLRKENAEFWVGYDENKGLILHPHCPFDYCTSEKMYLKVTNSDKQCNNNRSGLLCGRCDESLSLVLGSSRCLHCSNSYLSLLAVFALAGIALVLLLLLLRLTVAAGTINGLVFYANIITMNSATLFRPKTTNILTVFIAWLNLDLGIEMCFYNGMEHCVKTWLQFVFPLYVWGLVGLIIVGSHYSFRMARMLGKNPVAVLATLFLLSYAKLLRTAIAALSYTALQYPNSQTAVWLYDGSIGYFSHNHILLLIAALFCLMILFLPYTILLIVAQWLQAKSNWRVFSWINSRYVVPFIDAYHAPYSTRHRYWTGLMLLLRFVLFLVSAVNALGDPRVNLLAVLAALTFTTPAIIAGTGVYKSRCLCVLEISFLVNLIILFSVTLYIYPNEANQNAVTFTSVSIALATFTGIVIYHSIQQIRTTQLWRKLCPRHDHIRDPLNSDSEVEEDLPERVYVSERAPTQTVVDIRVLQQEHLAELQDPQGDTY